jgi:hypothetical protein
MPEPAPFQWKTRLPIRSPQKWAKVEVTETVDREMVIAETTMTLAPGKRIRFVVSWPRTDKQGYNQVHQIARAEIPPSLWVAGSDRDIDFGSA